MRREEKLLEAWVSLSSILKNNRITKGLMYNESIIMLLAYRKYQTSEEKKISLKEIIQTTNMQKSLVNRTVNALIDKNLLERVKSEGDKRIQYVQCVKENIETFLMVHKESLQIVSEIVSIIGEKDTDTFISIVNKLKMSGYKI
jgi:DNA-binding MarR family transcriptional regulator